ncbi:MAG: DUF2269 family protein [Methyloligellaceae bacterium]
MDLYALLKLAHLLGAAVLFGTGLGIAFFMFWADRTGDVPTVAATARAVVLADYLFTATAVVLQPITGVGLALHLGYSLWEGWILLSLALYAMIGACWLPVVWLQRQMRDLAAEAASDGAPLTAVYRRHMRHWFLLGWPAFLGVLAIYWLMITRPDLG